MTCRTKGCQEQAASKRTQCQQHLDYAKEHQKKQRAERRARGICAACTKPLVVGHVHCEEHRQKYCAASKQRRDKALTSGLCSNDGCGEPIVDGKTRCAIHLELLRERQRAKTQALINARVCVVCRHPSNGKVRCIKCSALNVEQQRRLMSERQSASRCVYCGDKVNQPLWGRRKRVACDKCRQRRSGYSAQISNRFGRARRQFVVSKGWTITLVEYTDLLQQPCHYCELPQDPTDEGVGLDRLNNDRGYHRDNVVSCCPVCNVVRNNIFTPLEMKLLGPVIRQIKSNRDLHFRPNQTTRHVG